MKALKILAERMTAGLRWITLAILAVMCVVTFLQVVTRYVFNAPFSWTEELARYLIIWLTFLGFGLVIHKRTEMSVSFFRDMIKGRPGQLVDLALAGIVLGFLAIFFVQGVLITFESREIMTIALGVPWSYVNVAAPLGGFCMLALYAVRFIDAAAALGRPLPEPGSGGDGCPPEGGRS